MDGVRIAYRTSGGGPALLAPECNYTWTPAFEALMAHHFTLVVASPRDFGASERAGAPYDPKLWASDMLSVMTHLGHATFSVFGYSFTGAFGPWLALKLQQHAMVQAVVAGGFPVLGDYRITARDVGQQLAELEKDERVLAELEKRFDLRAGAAFYRDLALLEPDALVDDLRCPLYCFWDGRDVDAVEMVMPHAELADGLTRRGVAWTLYSGMDHEALNADLAIAWPAAEAWLLDQVGR